MYPSYHARERFHPLYSLLGRWLLHQTGDRRRAEALLILVLSGAVTLLVLAGFGLAALVPSSLPAAVGLSSAVLLLLLTGVVGFQPALRVTCTPAALHLQQGTRACTLPYEQIAAAESLDPLLFHRHYRRYRAVRCFVVHPERDLLLLRTAEGPPIVLNLPPDDQEALRALLVGLALGSPDDGWARCLGSPSVRPTIDDGR